MPNRRIVIAAGGTGGHVFPALSLAYQLKERGDFVQFIGGGLQKNPFFEKDSFAFREVASGRPSFKTPGFPLSIARGTWQSVRALKEFQADLLIGFGSFYTLPVLLAARLLAIPYVIHEQNSVPGRVNRLFTRSAQLTAVHFPSAALKVRGNPCLVAMPLRPGFQKDWCQKEAVADYGLSSEIPVMLVFGGSQGAEAINRLLYESAPLLKSWQILHFTGNGAWQKLLTRRYQEAGIKACVKVFETDMAKAWGAACMAISRAGAASIAEQIASAVPGILIPYPFATDRHQEMNADYLVALGGAVKLSQSSLTCNFFIETIDRIVPVLDDMRNTLKQHHVQQTAFIDRLEVV